MWRETAQRIKQMVNPEALKTVQESGELPTERGVYVVDPALHYHQLPENVRKWLSELREEDIKRQQEINKNYERMETLKWFGIRLGGILFVVFILGGQLVDGLTSVKNFLVKVFS